jgi:hypothetical protein
LVDLSDHLRGYHATKYFCDPAWNSIAYARLEISIWIRRATWILPEGSGFKPLEELIPEYFKDASKSGMLSRNLTATERTKMCAMVQTYLPTGETL